MIHKDGAWSWLMVSTCCCHVATSTPHQGVGDTVSSLLKKGQMIHYIWVSQSSFRKLSEN